MTTTHTVKTVAEIKFEVAKAGIWARAKNTANPKGTILNMGYMKCGAGDDFTTVNAYNTALAKAKAWAKA